MKRTVRDLLNRPRKPEMAEALDSFRVRESAEASGLPQRPFARFVDGFGWIIDSVTAMSAEYDGPPEGAYSVTIMPRRYFM